MYPIQKLISFFFTQQPIYYTLYFYSRIFYVFISMSPWGKYMFPSFVCFFFFLVASISPSYFFLLVVIALWVFWSMWFLMFITITLFFYSPTRNHLVGILVMVPNVHWYCFLIYSFGSWSPCWSPCCDFKCSLVSPSFLLLLVILFLGVCY
jgi:hypothetical protein